VVAGPLVVIRGGEGAEHADDDDQDGQRPGAQHEAVPDDRAADGRGNGQDVAGQDGALVPRLAELLGRLPGGGLWFADLAAPGRRGRAIQLGYSRFSTTSERSLAAGCDIVWFCVA